MQFRSQDATLFLFEPNPLVSLAPPPSDRDRPRGGRVVRSAESILREIRLAFEALPALIPSEQVHGQSGVLGIGKVGNEIVIDLGRVVVPDEVVIFPARIPTEDSGGFPPGLEVEISEDTTFSRGVRLGRWVGESPASVYRPISMTPPKPSASDSQPVSGL